MKLVSTNTPARIINTNTSVPLIKLVKYRTAIIAANINLMILSAEPMFLFIINQRLIVKH